MKTLKQVLAEHNDAIKDSFLSIQDRLGIRLCQFLTEEQAKTIGFECKEGATWEPPIPFTEENVLKQLKQDVEFGWEKACGHRGISANLMYDVVLGWCKILENEFADWDDYEPYGTPLFLAVSTKYGFGLDETDFYPSEDW
jgi:hypothetical protein